VDLHRTFCLNNVLYRQSPLEIQLWAVFRSFPVSSPACLSAPLSLHFQSFFPLEQTFSLSLISRIMFTNFLVPFVPVAPCVVSFIPTSDFPFDRHPRFLQAFFWGVLLWRFPPRCFLLLLPLCGGRFELTLALYRNVGNLSPGHFVQLFRATHLFCPRTIPPCHLYICSRCSRLFYFF